MTTHPTPTRHGLLDFFLNGWEHCESDEEVIAYLVEWGWSREFAVDMTAAWNKDRPDLKRPGEGQRVSIAIMVQQEAAEILVDTVLGRHSEVPKAAKVAKCRFECGRPATVLGTHFLLGRVHACRTCARENGVEKAKE